MKSAIILRIFACAIPFANNFLENKQISLQNDAGKRLEQKNPDSSSVDLTRVRNKWTPGMHLWERMIARSVHIVMSDYW